ncbi:MAG: CNNM domain-containing protein [Christensenellaceae bacterium]
MFGAIILQFVLIFLNAVFASAEIAVISTNETKLQKMAERGDKRAKRLVKITSQPARFYLRFKWQSRWRDFRQRICGR